MHSGAMNFKGLLQYFLIVMPFGLMEWLPGIPLCNSESDIAARRALTFDRNVAQPSRHPQPRLFGQH